MFEIPRVWADAHTGGAILAVGRYRDGGLSGMGPSLFAYAPWQDGSPPPPDTHLSSRAMLRYSSRVGDPTNYMMNGFRDPDEWEGGAWITAGDKTAVIFVGTKATGPYWWYGYYSPAGDGMPCVHTAGDIMCSNADGTPCAPALTGECEGRVLESRGWWSSQFDAQILFYDPEDFAAVLDGEMEPYGPQPYAVLDIDEHLFLNAAIETGMLGMGDQRRYRIGEMAYDPERNFLYVFEKFAEGAKPVVHVWRINTHDPNVPGDMSIDLNLPAGWSMISLPVLPSDRILSSVFPHAVVAYRFEQGIGYVRVNATDTLETGKGYWILLHDSHQFKLTGQRIPEYNRDIAGNGWEMIGGCSAATRPSAEGCIIGVIYRYVPGIGYQRVLDTDNLEPGKGYWILLRNVTGACKLTVGSAGE